MIKIVTTIIKWYQIYLSGLLGSQCRFYPSCSEYVREAICEYGFFPGTFKGALRIMRCHPFSAGGYDPIVK